MTELRVENVHKSFATQAVLTGLDLAVDDGEFVTILGVSGSGKTTLLRIIAGFDRADRGRVRLGSDVVDDESTFVAPNGRRVGYVPQEGGLFPHLTIAQNVAFGLERSQRRGPKVTRLLELVDLGAFADRLPHQLSGGQQQRVALARALAIEPSLVLLDEPFTSLDTSLRASVRADVRRVLREANATALLVTHDQAEALSMADRVAVLHDGQVEQFDTPATLYGRPRSEAVASLFGEVNLLLGTVQGARVATVLGDLEAAADSRVDLTGANVVSLVRPEQICLTSRDESAVRARVTSTEFYGHDAVIKARLGDTAQTAVIVRTSQLRDLPELGTEVGVVVRGPVVVWGRR